MKLIVGNDYGGFDDEWVHKVNIHPPGPGPVIMTSVVVRFQNLVFFGGKKATKMTRHSIFVVFVVFVCLVLFLCVLLHMYGVLVTPPLLFTQINLNSRL
jgi:hypothetical protein